MFSTLFSEKRFHSTEATLSYVEGPPHGAPLLLLHGVTSRWQPFQPILPALAEEYHLYALDMRGHGSSSRTPGAYRLDDYTRDIQQFIAHQIQAPAAIYGHSLGALVAINLAAQQPQSVRALILGDPPLYYHNTPIQDTFWLQAFTDLLELMLDHPDPTDMGAWLAQNFPNMSPERREERLRSLQGLDPDVVRAVISDALMQDVSLSALISHLACPALLLRGNPKLGSALREQDVDFAVRHFPNLQVLEMGSVGHGIIPAALLPQLVEFIDVVISR